MRAPSRTHLLAPTVGTGVLMAVYLLARPYGDAGDGAAAAYASTAWVVAHVCGTLALASAARLGLRLSDLSDDVSARLARWSGLLGVVLVLPFYGLETFGLHAIGERALTDPAMLELTDEIRYHPAAIAGFGIGLLLISVAGVAIGVTATRSLTMPAWAAWPLAAAIALFPAQYFVPPGGRIAFGVLYAFAAAVFLAGALRAVSSDGRDSRAAAVSSSTFGAHVR